MVEVSALRDFFWLQKNVIDGDKDAYALVMTHVLYDFQDKIKQSHESNKAKSTMLNTAILLGVSSPLIFALTWLLLKLSL